MNFHPMPVRAAAHALRLLAAVVFASCTSAARADYYIYPFDPAFNGGLPLEDRFANTDANDYFAQRLARAANGDLVVAGIVPAAFQSSGDNVGLVRYSASGGRTSWSNPSPAYASYFNNYLTYPNSTGAKYTSVVDLKVLDGYIYVLVDNAAGGAESDVYVIVFRDDGTFIGEYASFTTGLDEHGAGFVPYAYVDKLSQTQRRLIAVADYVNGSNKHVMTIKRFAIDAGGALSVDNGFGPYGNGANDITLPPERCDEGALCDLQVRDVAAVATTSPFPRIYVAASAGNQYLFNSTVHNMAVVGIDGSDGNLLAGFGSQVSGIYYANSSPGGLTRIAATGSGGIESDQLYVLGASSDCFFLACSYVSYLSKVLAVSGLPPPLNGSVPAFSWGDGGDVTFGNAYFEALMVDAQRVMAVGGIGGECSDGEGGLYPCGLGVAAGFSVVDGAVDGSSYLSAPRAGGAFWAAVEWQDVIAGNAPGTYAATGPMGNAAPNPLAQFGTVQLVATLDGIFRDDFD